MTDRTDKPRGFGSKTGSGNRAVARRDQAREVSARSRLTKNRSEKSRLARPLLARLLLARSPSAPPHRIVRLGRTPARRAHGPRPRSASSTKRGSRSWLSAPAIRAAPQMNVLLRRGPIASKNAKARGLSAATGPMRAAMARVGAQNPMQRPAQAAAGRRPKSLQQQTAGRYPAPRYAARNPRGSPRAADRAARKYVYREAAEGECPRHQRRKGPGPDREGDGPRRTLLAPRCGGLDPETGASASMARSSRAQRSTSCQRIASSSMAHLSPFASAQGSGSSTSRRDWSRPRATLRGDRPSSKTCLRVCRASSRSGGSTSIPRGCCSSPMMAALPACSVIRRRAGFGAIACG